MRRHHRYPTHGPRRRRWRPWRRICRCGLAAWPCPALAMLHRQARWQAPVPAWNAPTGRLPVAPLLTRGQAARSRQAGRW